MPAWLTRRRAAPSPGRGAGREAARSRLPSVSPDDPRRSRLLPRGALLGLGGVCLVVLAIVFPGEGLVRLIERTGNHALAIDYLHNLLRIHPGDPRLLVLLAQRYLAVGEAVRAWEVLAQVDTPEAGRLREQVSLAAWRGARDAGRADEAARWRARVLEAVLARRPGTGAEWMEILELLQELGAFDRAAALLAQAGPRGHAEPGQAEALARRLLALSRPRAAAELLTEAGRVSSGPRRRELWRQAAAAWLGAGEPQRAYQVAIGLGTAALAEPADAWLLARLAVSAGQPADAARWLRIALGMNTPGGLHDVGRTDTQGLDEAWRIFVAAQDLDAALQVSGLATRIEPDSITWAERHARTLEWAGRAAEALPVWVRLLHGPLARDAQDRVRALAPGLYDWEAMAAYWRSRAATGPLPREDWLAYIGLLRQQGRVREAIQTARRAAEEYPELLQLLAQLLSSEGEIDEALAVYLEAGRRGLLDTASRLQGATALLAAARLEDARRLLAQDPAPGTAEEVHANYLELRADLAWELGDHPQALRDYLTLHTRYGASPDALNDFRAQRLLVLTRRMEGPAAGLRLAPALWAHRPSTGLGELWLDIVAQQPTAQSLQAWERAVTTSPAGAPLQTRVPVLQRRASLWRTLGHPRNALPLLHRARSLAPQHVGVLIDWVALLTELQMHEELRATLAREGTRLERDPEGALTLAQAARELGQTAWAVRLMRGQSARRERDPLWLAGYADLLDEVGQRGQAARARQRAWELLLAQARTPPQDARQDLARLLLQLRLAPGRTSQAEQQALVRALRGRLAAGDLDLQAQAHADAAIVNWLLARDFHSWADWWLARRVVAGAVGSGLRLLRSLPEGDRERVREELGAARPSLSAQDRAEASWLIGEREAALAETGQLLERAAARDDHPDRLRDVATIHADRERQRAHHAAVGVQHERIGSLAIEQTRAAVRLSLGDDAGLEIHRTQERLDRQGGSVLAAHPDAHATAGLVAQWQGGERWSFSLGISRHGTRERDTALQVQARYQLDDTRRLTLRGDLQAPVHDTDLLRMAARRDGLLAQWEGSRGRAYALAGVSFSRYRTETGGALGRSHELRAEAGYWLRRAEPVLAVRTFASVRDEQARATPRPELARWVASGEALSGAQVLPGSQEEFGLGLRWGQADGLPSRRWWPQVDLTLAVSSRNGFTPAAWVGWRGPLAGKDELEIGLQRSRSDTGPGQQIRLQYRRWWDR